VKFLYVAELVGKAGIYALKKALPELKRRRGIDFTLVCADGVTGGNGLGRNHAAYIRKLGADAITTGECCFYKKDLVENWPKLPYVLRPCNLGAASPGFGRRVFNRDSPCPVAVLVLLGTNFNRLRVNNPFEDLKSLLEKLRSETPYVIVDFHAWASGEKRTFFAAAAGLCTAVIGSHNRVQTTDEEVLPGGTAVICDAGRTGSAESVGGTDTAERIREYLTGIPNWTREAWDKPELQGVIVEAGGDGRALSIERLRIPVPAPAAAVERGAGDV
jgi:metallophosphoesterase (TIGR00282 family)